MAKPTLCSTRQAAEQLGVSVRRLHYLVTTGELTPAHRIEGLRGPLLFDQADISKAKRKGIT